MARFNCPNCGASVALRATGSRMADCGSCGTTCFLGPGGPEPLGLHGEMTEVPALFHLGRAAHVDGLTLLPVGHVRYGYGTGFWDEYWCIAGGQGLWVSTDEGDVVIEEPLSAGSLPASFTPRLGAEVTLDGVRFVVTEVATATCMALRGEFPEPLRIGETFQYAGLLGSGGAALTWEEGHWFRGRWIDPFAVREAG